MKVDPPANVGTVLQQLYLLPLFKAAGKRL